MCIERHQAFALAPVHWFAMSGHADVDATRTSRVTSSFFIPGRSAFSWYASVVSGAQGQRDEI